MNAFDKTEELMKKRRLTKKDKCEFLATLPDIVISMTGFEPIKTLPSWKNVAEFYTDDDINELFDYWFDYFKGLRRKNAWWNED